MGRSRLHVGETYRVVPGSGIDSGKLVTLLPRGDAHKITDEYARGLVYRSSWVPVRIDGRIDALPKDRLGSPDLPVRGGGRGRGRVAIRSVGSAAARLAPGWRRDPLRYPREAWVREEGGGVNAVVAIVEHTDATTRPWRWAVWRVGSRAGHDGYASTRREAKAIADDRLASMGRGFGRRKSAGRYHTHKSHPYSHPTGRRHRGR